MPILWICGAPGVGKSVTAWELFTSDAQAEVYVSYLDIDQLDLGLGLVNVATMRDDFSHLGAHDVIINAHLTTPEDLRQVRRWTATTVVRLSADPRTIADHLLERRGGNDARLAGDDLSAAGDDYRAAVLSLAIEQQERLGELGEEDVVVDVSGRTVDHIIDEIDSGRLRA
jgi:broad-specificity NMP kinase